MLPALFVTAVVGATWAETLPGDSLGSWSPSPCNRLVVVGATPGGEVSTIVYENLAQAEWCQVVLDGRAALGDVGSLGDREIGKRAGRVADAALVVRKFKGSPNDYVALSWVDANGELLRFRAVALGTPLSQRKSAVKPPPRKVAVAAVQPTSESSPSATVTPLAATVVSAQPATVVGKAEDSTPTPIRHEVRLDPFVMLHASGTQAGVGLSYQFALARFLSLKVMGRLPFATMEDPARLRTTIASHEALRENASLEAGLEFVHRDWRVSPVVGVLGGVAATSYNVFGTQYDAGLRPQLTGIVGLRWHVARNFALSLEMQNLLLDSTATNVGPCSSAELTTLATTATRSIGQVSAACSASNLSRDGQLPAHYALEITQAGILSWHPVVSLGFAGLF